MYTRAIQENDAMDGPLARGNPNPDFDLDLKLPSGKLT